MQIKSSGGPSAYYDFPKDPNTLNDLIEFKSERKWGPDTFHLANIFKATWRWGEKEGVPINYDVRKIIYSACRILARLEGKTGMKNYLIELILDPQFKD